MSTQAQLDQADLALQRANDALNEARTNLIRAERRLRLAQEAGSEVDPGVLSQAQQNLAIARSQLAAADSAYTAAQTNYTQVFNSFGTDAAQDPQVNNGTATVPRVAEVAPAPASNPPNPQVPPTEEPLRIDIRGVNSTTTNDEITPIEVQPAPVVTVDTTGTVVDPPPPDLVAPVEGGGFFGVPRDPAPVDDYEYEQYQAALAAEREAAEASTLREPTAVDLADDPQADPLSRGTPFDDNGNLNPGWALDGNDSPVYIGDDYFDPSLTDSATASRVAAQQAAQTAQARAQAALQQQRKLANDGDWRVRLRLAPSANYLYRADNPGPLLQPLKETDGVVFPYTPQIIQAYRAEYSSTNLTHSNYRGFFYQGSQQEDIQINATFTAQDTREANYLLAVMTFFKAVTKMFYGQDAQRGTPPPLVFLQGFGRYQFNLNPCVVTQFNYTLPNDVDYIRALSPNINGTNQRNLREGRQALPTNPFSAAVSRIENILKPQLGTGLSQYDKPAPPTLGTNSPTYVPTKIDISLVLHPMQSRQQVSQEFSLKNYANGSLIEKGFW